MGALRSWGRPQMTPGAGKARRDSGSMIPINKSCSNMSNASPSVNIGRSPPEELPISSSQGKAAVKPTTGCLMRVLSVYTVLTATAPAQADTEPSGSIRYLVCDVSRKP